MDKTIAMKLLENRGVPYDVVTYPPMERDAEKLAVLFGVPAAQVYKTLVVMRITLGKPVLVMVAADRQLNLKKLAKALGEKKMRMAKHAEAEKLTGLQVGGISPLALLNKRFQICADAAIDEQEAVYVSAGRKGINLRVPVEAVSYTHLTLPTTPYV